MVKTITDEDPVVFRDTILRREWGIWLTGIQEYIRAIEAFKESKDSADGDDPRTLFGLCKALSKYARYQEAEDVSQQCLNIEPDNYKAVHMRSEAHFNVGKFGYSLIHAHNGLRGRKMPFQWNVYQGNETIETCIGRNTSPQVLRLLIPWISKMMEHRKVLISKLDEEEDELKGFEVEQAMCKVNDSKFQLQAYLKKLEKIVTKIYMHALAEDKYFVERLTESPEMLTSWNKKSNEELRNIATSVSNSSAYLQDILRTRKPLYVTLFERMKIPKGHKEMMEREKEIKIQRNEIEAELLLNKLNDLRTKRDYFHFFQCADRVKDKFDSHTVKMLPSKETYLENLYDIIASVYIDARNLTDLKDEETRVRYLKHHIGIQVAIIPRDTDLAWVPTLNEQAARKTFCRRLAMAWKNSELAWLYHDYCKFHIETKGLHLARFYIKKARDTAELEENERWLLNTQHLLIRIEVNQNNKNEAKEAATLALTSAKNLGIDHIIDFYERMIDMIDDLDFERVMRSDPIPARQQLIRDLMPRHLQTEIDYLWMKMEAVPANRRLSVIPGCKPINKNFKLPSKRNTILPDPRKDPERDVQLKILKKYQPSERVLGFMDFDLYQ